MSGQTTTWFRRELLESAFHKALLPVTNLQVALTRRPPASNASITQLDEPSGNGYARAAYTLGVSQWNLSNNNEMVNTESIFFPRATGEGWGTVTGWALISVTGSRVMAVGTLIMPIRVVAGVRPIVKNGTIAFGQLD